MSKSQKAELVNEEIALPVDGKLKDENGRVWGVTLWSPTAKLGEVTRCTAELVLIGGVDGTSKQ